MQFDVFRNPISRARKLMPYVAVMQSDISNLREDHIIAFLADASLLTSNGILTPPVVIEEKKFLVMLPLMTTLPAFDLRHPIDNIARHRDEIVRGIDWLFLGV